MQAKRYKDTVPPDAVRALAGVMNDKAAAKGILVTTAWYGKSSLDFAPTHRTHATHRRTRPQSPPPRTPRHRRPHRPPQTPPRLAPPRHPVTPTETPLVDNGQTRIGKARPRRTVPTRTRHTALPHPARPQKASSGSYPCPVRRRGR
ncbi:restriction endonuclease [Streptacidiphilus sp. PAMC 29251]